MLTNTNRIWDKNSGVCGSENPIFDLVLGLKQEIIRILIKGPHCKEEHSAQVSSQSVSLFTKKNACNGEYNVCGCSIGEIV